MRLDSPVVAFPAWLGGCLTRGQLVGLGNSDKPRRRAGVAYSTIALRRMALGLTQARVADRLGTSVDSVKLVERRPPHMRGDKRNVAMRARMNDLYLSIERGRVKA